MKIIRFALLFLGFAQVVLAQRSKVILPEGNYPYWPTYNYLEETDLSAIKAQPWQPQTPVIEGWDWSLPPFVKPSERSSVGLQRNIGLSKKFLNLNLQFPANSTGLLWVKWRDIEKTPGDYDFSGILNRIKQAQNVGVKICLRILCYSKSRNNGKTEGDAPLWLEDMGVPTLTEKRPGANINFDPMNPIFHQRYLMLINALAKTDIPKLLHNAYVGFASPTFGDEGIGPYPETNSAANDTVKYVRENLDAWGQAFKGMETKVFMGGACEYGFKKGFGTRRGFVEMYTYRIPNADLGQYVDQNGYLHVDENAPIIKYKCFNGEVNEEYEPAWATEERDFRYGISTKSFPYRYFMSNLRVLQMQCTYVHTTGHLLPQMLQFIALELGRTVEDAPDVWCFLNTYYQSAANYHNNDWQTPKRTITDTEQKEGIEVKNFERWLYQRDAPGYETQPAEKIQHAIIMFGIQKDKNYDYIARSGKKIGFNIDNRWSGLNHEFVIKVTYLDQNAGTINLVYNDGKGKKVIKQTLIGDHQLKTANFLVPKMALKTLPNGFDFALESGDENDITVSMVRVIQSSEKANK